MTEDTKKAIELCSRISAAMRDDGIKDIGNAMRDEATFRKYAIKLGIIKPGEPIGELFASIFDE